MNKHQKGFAQIIIVLIILILVGIGGAGYYLINKQLTKQTACTEEAKICSDGSLVKRSGPNCEFVTCPEAKADEMINWKTYTKNEYGFEIKYPSDWESPFKGWDSVDFGAGKSVDSNNYCAVSIISQSGSNESEITDLLKRGYVKNYIEIDGVDSVRLTRNPSGAGLTEAVYFESNGKSFRIGRNRGLGNTIEQDCIKNFNQILFTFKFISTSSNSVIYKKDFNGSDLTGRLYKSEDNGKTWKEILKQYKGEIIYAVDPKDSNIIYAGDVSGNMMADDMDIDLLKSTDAGENWIDISKGIINQVDILFGIKSLSIDPNNSNIINVLIETNNTNKVNFKSLDGGNTWTK